MHSSLSLSIIVPVLNEAGILEPFLARLRQTAPSAQIIVVDGGSDDATFAIAQRIADRVLAAPRGRAAQMNAGAANAHNDVLWFLHADLTVPANAVRNMEHLLADPRIAGGCFRLHYPRRDLVYRVSDSLGNIGVEVFGFALGDHGIFCRREAFDRVGGYSDVPILEDAELYRKLARTGRMVQLRDEIVGSPRTFEKHGRYRTTTIYFFILALYVFRVPIPFLYRIYRRFRGSDRAGVPADLATFAR